MRRFGAVLFTLLLISVPVAAAVQSSGVVDIRADEVHQEGYRGENVTVGVVDYSFDTSNSEIAGNIEASKSFRGDGRIYTGDDHGTAVGEIVVDTAPNVTLKVATFDSDSSQSYLDAIQWLDESGADVIVSSVVFFGGPNDGTSELTNTVENIVDNGTVFVNSAGNTRERHWYGNTTDSDGDNLVTFEDRPDQEALEVTGYTVGDQIYAVVTWFDAGLVDNERYHVELYKNGTSVANGSDISGRLAEQVTYTPEDTNANLTIMVERDSGVSESEKLEFFLSGSSFKETDYIANGSTVAPAIGEEVTAVGAYSVSDGQIRQYSAHGPSRSGTKGITVIGPDGVETSSLGYVSGTSFSAPHVGGAVALMLQKNSALKASDVNRILRNTATGDYPTYRAGGGAIDAYSAWQAVAFDSFQSDEGVSILVSDGTSVTANKLNSSVRSGALVDYRLVSSGSANATLYFTDLHPDVRLVTHSLEDNVTELDVVGQGEVSYTFNYTDSVNGSSEAHPIGEIPVCPGEVVEIESDVLKESDGRLACIQNGTSISQAGVTGSNVTYTVVDSQKVHLMDGGERVVFNGLKNNTRYYIARDGVRVWSGFAESGEISVETSGDGNYTVNSYVGGLSPEDNIAYYVLGFGGLALVIGGMVYFSTPNQRYI